MRVVLCCAYWSRRSSLDRPNPTRKPVAASSISRPISDPDAGESDAYRTSFTATYTVAGEVGSTVWGRMKAAATRDPVAARPT